MSHDVESIHRNGRCPVKVNDVIIPFSGRLSLGEVGVCSLANTFLLYTRVVPVNYVLKL